MDNIVGRLQSLFPPHQFDVIIGSLLGDARLECRSKGLRVPVTARFRAHHGEKQKKYIFWKYQVLQSIVSRKPRRIVRINWKRNQSEASWYFHTKSLEELGIVYGYFYRNGIKILPENIFNLITPRMIAVWFMDDGSNTRESFTLNTHSFSEKDQKQIINYLNHEYNITATLIKDRTKLKVRIGKNDYQKFIAIVKPFIITSMTYKIVNPRNDLAASNGQS